MKIKAKKLHEDAIAPQYATPGAACFDLHTTDDGVMFDGYPMLFRTGLAFEVPEGHVMLVYSRSGMGYKHGLRPVNCVGVIDSDYRGEVTVKLYRDKNDSRAAYRINKGDRIAQAMVVPVDQVEFELVEELSETDRGDGGYGSTGR